MPKIVMYTKDYCGYCDRAKALLNSKQLAYTEIRVDLDPAKLDEMIKLSSGRRTVPQIFINGQSIGGSDDLANLAKTGQLDQLLA